MTLKNILNYFYPKTSFTYINISYFKIYEQFIFLYFTKSLFENLNLKPTSFFKCSYAYFIYLFFYFSEDNFFIPNDLNNILFKNIKNFFLFDLRPLFIKYKTLFILIKNFIYKYSFLILFNLKWLWLSALLTIFYFFFSLFYIQIDLTKQIVVWYVLLILYYLLLSGFNSFLIKYKYGKFTSAIQRFWKRTGMIFWLIEGFLFSLFFYYFLNSSQEPLYMFDYANLNQEFLIQLKISYKNLVLLNIAIWLSFFLLLSINYYIYFQNLLILIIIFLIIVYMLYIESYQFVYIISTFVDKEWIFDEIQNLWVLEIEQNNLRVKQQYFVLCLIAKYWHFIFIFISWSFFLVKSLEVKNISITILGFNTQNLIILSVLNLLCLVQWIKIFFKKFLEITYSWFFIEYDEKFFITLLYEFYTILNNFFSLNKNFLISFRDIIPTSNVYSISELFIWKL